MFGSEGGFGVIHLLILEGPLGLTAGFGEGTSWDLPQKQSLRAHSIG